MKKIFSLVVAMFMASSMMFAGQNLISLTADSLETWFGDANWAPDNGGTGVYDEATGKATISINSDRSGQWHAQVKFHTSLKALDAAKQYDFSVKLTANANIQNVTVKVFDDVAPIYEPNLALVASTAKEFKVTNFAGVSSNGVIVFDFGSAHAGDVIEIEDLYIGESEVTTISCADIMNKQNNEEFVLSAFDVVYVNGSYTYIKDATGASLIYKSNFGLKAGDHVAAGLAGKLSIYNGLYEVVPTSTLSDLTVTAGTAPAFDYAKSAPGQSNMNEVVIYKDVHFAADCSFNDQSKTTLYGIWGTDTIAFYNTFKIAYPFEATKAYNIVAANSIFQTNYQAHFISAEEYIAPVIDEDTVDNGLYDPEEAEITSTYFATGGNWAADNESSAELIDGQLFIHILMTKENQWQSQIFLSPGFVFEAGKSYRMEFDLKTNNQLGGVVIKVGDTDNNPYYYSYPNDNIFLANQEVHYVADSIKVHDELEEDKRQVIFSIGWCPAGTEVHIHNISIVEIGEYVPEETHVYIKHPWGTGADADWSWQEMSEDTYGIYDAYVYEGKWGGVGCNIADNAEGNNADWYPVDKIQFLSPDELVLAAPAVGTDAKFVYIPDLKGSSIISPVKVIYTPTALDLINSDATVLKTMINGQVVIIRNGVQYNMLGTEL